MPLLSRSDVSYAKTTLAYPIYAAEFDPYDRGYLVVGGGGGEGRSGVPNQISVLDVSSRASITTAVDIDLSREEDSVSSLASLATKDGLITFAGINSSQANQDASKNEHFRAFSVRYPPRKRQKTQSEVEAQNTEGKIELLGSRSLFTPSPGPKKETYQRLVRLSPAKRQESASKRIGAIATGLATNSEIIVFNATVSIPEASDIITKIALPKSSEAADLDIALTEESEFSVAYCDDYNLYEQTIAYDFDKRKAEKRPPGPRRFHQMPFPDAVSDPKTRPKFRCLRFLNAENVIALVNKANKSGAELRVYHLYPTGPALMTKQEKLPSHIRQASSMDVCILDTDAEGNHQVVIAVAGQDISIEIFTTNFRASSDTFSSFKNYSTFKQVHQQQMTKICFSPFHSPVRAPDPVQIEGADAATTQDQPAPIHPGPQYIKLASVSYGNTVVVDTFPLSPIAPQEKSSRYVLSHPSDERFWTVAYVGVFSFMILITAFLLQSFMSGYAGTQLGPLAMLPQSVQNFLNMPAGPPIRRAKVSHVTQVHITHVSLEAPASSDIQSSLEELVQSFSEPPSEVSEAVSAEPPSEPVPEAPTVSEASASTPPSDPEPSTAPEPSDASEAVPVSTHTNLREALFAQITDPVIDSESAPPSAVVIHDGPEDHDLSFAVHPDKESFVAENPDTKHWHELEDHQKSYWKSKLIAAGHWAEHEGEAVLKGVLWSTYAGFVGDVAGEVLREL